MNNQYYNWICVCRCPEVVECPGQEPPYCARCGGILPWAQYVDYLDPCEKLNPIIAKKTIFAIIGFVILSIMVVCLSTW